MEPSKIRAKNLKWDKWNRGHIAKHNLTPRQVENVLFDENRKFLDTYDNRFAILGRMGKRLLFVVLAKQTGRKFYVVSARDMNKRERNFYRDNHG